MIKTVVQPDKTPRYTYWVIDVENGNLVAGPYEDTDDVLAAADYIFEGQKELTVVGFVGVLRPSYVIDYSQ